MYLIFLLSLVLDREVLEVQMLVEAAAVVLVVIELHGTLKHLAVVGLAKQD
jgi:hypothetical protein